MLLCHLHCPFSCSGHNGSEAWWIDSECLLEGSSLNSHFVITFHLQGINWFVFYLDGATMEVCEQTHERTGLKQSPSLFNTNHAKLVLFHMECSIYVCMCVCVEGGREEEEEIKRESAR
jgi:hypothetical protein